MKNTQHSFFGELKRRIVLAAACVAIPFMVQASHGAASVSDIDYTGMGSHSGSYTHSTFDHVWVVFNANAGDVISISINTGFQHHYWIYRANNGCIQPGNTPACLANLNQGGNGATNGSYSYTIPSTGQYAFQLDSYIGQSGSYNFTLSGSTATTVLCTPTGAGPSFTSCPGAVTANLTSGCSMPVGYSVAASSGTLTYAKTGATSGSGSGTGSGTSFNKGVTNVTVTATGTCGAGTSTCSFTVTVNDNILPNFNFVPGTVNVNAAAGTCGATPAIGNATATDNCGGVTVTNNAPSSFAVGATTVTWTATDASGNQRTATQIVNVEDVEDPTISNVPANITVGNDAGVCGATVSWTEPTAADNCSGVSMPASALNGTVFPLGTTTVSYTATDANGNTAGASFTITVNDTENPTIVGLPSNISVGTDAGVCGATVSWTEPTAADNCSGATIGASALNGTVFPVGTTTISYTATDANGNEANGSFTVTVADNELPVVTAPASITMNGYCNPIAVTLGNATSSDNCGVASTTNNAPATFPVGTTVVTYTATDVNGNTNTATQTVTVTPGTLVGSMTVSPVNTVSGQAAYTIFKGYGPQSVTLGASATGGTAPYAHSWSTSATASSISVSPAATSTYNVTITDAHGCTSSLSQTINVVNAVCGNNNNKVLVCHNGHTICIAASAVPAHLAHAGDYLGDCGTANKNSNNEEEEAHSALTELASNIEIYPNPTTGVISIRLPENGDATVTVMDITGKLIAQQEVNMQTIQLDLSGNAKGVYLVKLVTAGKTFQSRISLQ